jgi:hypothetical protein
MGSSSSVLQAHRQLYLSLYQKIETSSTSQLLQANVIMILIGRVIASPSNGTPPLYSPLSHLSCVSYIITIEAYYSDTKSWHILAKETKVQNFYLVNIEDQPILVHVPAAHPSYPNSIKFIGKLDKYHQVNNQNRILIHSILKKFNVDLAKFSDDNLRVTEELIPLGEQIALLGKVVRSTESSNGYDMKELLPTSSHDYDRNWYQKHTFDSSDIENWSRLTSSQQYLCSDDPALMKGIHIQPLPPHLDIGVVLPGYHHSLMGVSHTDPQLQSEYRRPSVTGHPQITIPSTQSSMPQQITSPQQPVMMHQQSLVPPQAYHQQQQMISPQQQPAVMHQQSMVPIYQQQQQFQQPLAYQQSPGYQQPYAVPQQPQPYATYPQQQMPSVQPSGYQMMTQPSHQQLLHHGASAQFTPSQYSYPSPQQYPQQNPPGQQYPSTGDYRQSQPPQSQGYYPTQQPVQYHPGGYPKEPQYIPSALQNQSLPVAYAIPAQQQFQYPQQQQQQYQSHQPASHPQGSQFFTHGAYHDDDPW